MFFPSNPYVRELAARAISGCGAKPAAKAVGAAMDAVYAAAEAMAASPPQGGLRAAVFAPRPVCRSGCKSCCLQQIGITAAEAIRIALHVEALPADRRKALMAALAANVAATRGLTTSQYQALKPPCAFLDDGGACVIYPVRPLRCRGLVSTDASVCAALLDDFAGTRQRLGEARLAQIFPDDSAGPYNEALMGVLEGLAALSRKLVVSLEFQATVAALLRDPALARKWLAGAAPAAELHLRPDPA